MCFGPTISLLEIDQQIYLYIYIKIKIIHCNIVFGSKRLETNYLLAIDYLN